MKFSIKDFFSKCDQICRKLRIWSFTEEILNGEFHFFVQCLLQEILSKITTQHQQKSFLSGQILKHKKQLNRKSRLLSNIFSIKETRKVIASEKKLAIFFALPDLFFPKSTLVAVVEKPTFISLGFMKLYLLERSTVFRSATLMHFIIISGLTIRFTIFLMILNKSLYKYRTMGSSVWYLTENGCNISATKLKLSFAGVKRSLIADWRPKKHFEFGLFDFGSLCQKLLIFKMFGQISRSHSATCLSSTHLKIKELFVSYFTLFVKNYKFQVKISRCINFYMWKYDKLNYLTFTRTP